MKKAIVFLGLVLALTLSPNAAAQAKPEGKMPVWLAKAEATRQAKLLIASGSLVPSDAVDVKCARRNRSIVRCEVNVHSFWMIAPCSSGVNISAVKNRFFFRLKFVTMPNDRYVSYKSAVRFDADDVRCPNEPRPG